MEITKEELLTVPNGMTFGRLAISPLIAWKMYKNPAKAWPVAAAVAVSDNLDGFFARLGDRSPMLAKLGFRRSEIGRKADPFVDKIFTTEMLVAGMANGVIPKWLGALSLAQKGVISGLTIYNEANGIQLEVTKLGKRTEFITNAAIGSLFIAESITDDGKKEMFRSAAIALAAAGVAGASYATYDYAKTANQLKGQIEAEGVWLSS
ncbi:MAG TPA: CDP-alcohol phosphatidyltransferase family protein [Candidatus Saccharimonadales bacterium]|nr:CDP-alcohol phosphatidyltransferase family protein [Candidatus Saccharimonadales bacterium]